MRTKASTKKFLDSYEMHYYRSKIKLMTYFYRLDVPYATEIAMLKIHKLIELAILEHDGVHATEDEQLEVFIPDGEPLPSTIDSWARGTGMKLIAI